MSEYETRKIPASDKALRSLYMPASYTKNLKKGQGKKIKWERNEEKVGSTRQVGGGSILSGPVSLKSEYTFEKTSGKESKSGTPSIKGRKSQVYKGPISTETTQVDEQHQSLKTKGGGYDTIRIQQKKMDIDSSYRGYEKFNRNRGQRNITQTVQDKKGTVTKEIDLMKNKNQLNKVISTKSGQQVPTESGYGSMLTSDSMNLRKKFNTPNKFTLD